MTRYPRDLEGDVRKIEKTEKGKSVLTVVFAPDNLYEDEKFKTWVQVEGIEKTLEAQSRPTHFKGVATICTKLFNIVKPDNVYFGQKDAIQCIV